MHFTLAMRCSLVVFFLPSTPVPADETADTQAAPAWTDQVQTYSMLPLLPDTAKKMHVSVNGIWAGISSDHPLLPSREMIPSVPKRYGNDVAVFVNDSHFAARNRPASTLASRSLTDCAVMPSSSSGKLPSRPTPPTWGR